MTSGKKNSYKHDLVNKPTWCTVFISIF